jgi:DNA-binding response OmpR family regulator
MSKIMLVEDDNNLREIYEARLLAEGYEIVSAKDGEEALAMAVKEKPDLIIADVMMPKISGFDMLDILRSTPETKNAKIIMMTALGQAEDKARAEKLGADRYLVKSQVTLEDVARTAREVLTGESAAPAANATADNTATAATNPAPAAAQATPVAVAGTTDTTTTDNPQQNTPVPDPSAPNTTSIPVVSTPVDATAATPVSSAPSAATTDNSQPTNNIVPINIVDTPTSGPPPVPPSGNSDTPVDPASPTNMNSKVINPVSQDQTPADLEQLLQKEQAKTELAGQPGSIETPSNPAPGSSVAPTNTPPAAGNATDVGKISL